MPFTHANTMVGFLTEEANKVTAVAKDPGSTPPYEANQLDHIENAIETAAEDVQQLNSNEQTLKDNYLQLVEMRHVIEQADEVFNVYTVRRLRATLCCTDAHF